MLRKWLKRQREFLHGRFRSQTMKKMYFLYVFYISVYIWYLLDEFTPYIDYTIYSQAVTRFFNGEQFYIEGFVYLPSFFLLSPLVVVDIVYFLFLFICCIISVFVLLKLEKNIGIVFLFSLIQFTVLFNGNLEVFTFTLVLISCLYKYTRYVPPILLAFASLKLSVLFVVPFFLYTSENRKLFLILFSASMILLNFVFLLNFDLFFDYLAYGSGFTSVFNLFIRQTPFYIFYYVVNNYHEIKHDRLTNFSVV
ncbi:MAG: hypothetical protein ACFFCW_12220 [Candidatus Hodarchaeota archaeon]